MYAPPKDASVKTIDDPSVLEQYDGFILGVPTRYGNFPAQWKAFIDKTGKQWSSGGFDGKMAGVMVGSAGFGGGQESTVIATLSTLAHHGIIFVPLGYSKDFALMTDISEVRGGSPWGAGYFAATDGSRSVSEKELKVAALQGESFYKTVAQYVAGRK
jgi:NAD(P)H dehydrogenase (quinone)